MASSKLSGEEALISVTRATDIVKLLSIGGAKRYFKFEGLDFFPYILETGDSPRLRLEIMPPLTTFLKYTPIPASSYLKCKEIKSGA
jgi:hypothetical protein